MSREDHFKVQILLKKVKLPSSISITSPTNKLKRIKPTIDIQILITRVRMGQSCNTDTRTAINLQREQSPICQFVDDLTIIHTLAGLCYPRILADLALPGNKLPSTLVIGIRANDSLLNI